MRNFILIMLSFGVLWLSAQETGVRSFPSLGLTFTIPDGWVGQENESGYIMGSYTIPGAILVLPHQTSTLEQLRVEAAQGLIEEGVMLQLDGDVQDFSSTGLQADYQGTINFQSAKAFAVSLINPHGSGLTVLSMTDADQFSEVHRDLVRAIGKSVVFDKVATSVASSVSTGSGGEWATELQNARLTYMNSHYSSGGSYGGYSTGGGYSDKEIIDLCAQGYFNFSSSSTMSFDTGGGFGSSNSADNGAGKWRVVNDAYGQDLLELTYYNGKVQTYVLTMDGTKTLLDGYRYFRTYGTVADDGPDCF